LVLEYVQELKLNESGNLIRKLGRKKKIYKKFNYVINLGTVTRVRSDTVPNKSSGNETIQMGLNGNDRIKTKLYS
jgi:hypothetical protein